MNTLYQVIVELFVDSEYLTSLTVNSGIATLDTNQGILSTSMLINVAKKFAELKLRLDNFTYDIAFEEKVNLYDILLGLVKICSLSIS